jgi:hypothetical protein
LLGCIFIKVDLQFDIREIGVWRYVSHFVI